LPLITGFSYRRFVNFLEDRNITQSERITLRHVLDFMNTWKNYADITRKLETEKLKLFLIRLKRGDLASEIKTPRLTKQGEERRKPKPYTDEEVRKFREVADPATWLFFETSIKVGAAVSDLVQLQPSNLREGCVVLKRQKTRKPCVVPIDQDLYNRLKHSLPFYRPRWAVRPYQTGCQIWARQIRLYSQIAGIYIPGNLVHRGRDSFVEHQLVSGVPVAVIAARIGDRVDTLLKHYADLFSPKMQEANLEQPVVRL